jgi:ligand-binding SRPBCC domain-containing protein
MLKWHDPFNGVAMRTVRLTFESRIPRSAAELWGWSTSARGVQTEMAPLIRMTFPKGMQHIPQDRGSLGKPLGNCRFLLLGLVPIDLSRLTFVEMEPGRRFVEQSPLLSMKLWRHERRIEACEEGAQVVDTLEFTPRMAGGIVAWFVGRFFAHRHARLRRQFRERRAVGRSVGRSVSRAAGSHERADRIDVQPGECA